MGAASAPEEGGLSFVDVVTRFWVRGRRVWGCLWFAFAVGQENCLRAGGCGFGGCVSVGRLHIFVLFGSQLSLSLHPTSMTTIETEKREGNGLESKTSRLHHAA